MPDLNRAAALHLCVLVLAALASTARAQDIHVPIEQRMTAEQLRDTGLERLTAAELAELNRVIREQRAEQTEIARDARFGLRRSPSESDAQLAEPPRIDSAIAGEFRGWSPGTLITLANGQVWRVTEGSLQTRRLENPRVTITRSGLGSRFLTVEGQNARAKVSRVR